MSPHQLRKVLHEEVKKLSDQVIQKENTISDEQVENLKRLSLITDIYDRSRPKTKRKRWPMLVLLAATFLVVGLLLSFRVSNTEIELAITLTELRFELFKPTILTDAMVVSALGISELKEIRFPRARGRSAQTVQASEGRGTALRLAVIDGEQSQSTVTLTALLLPTGTLVRVVRTEIPNQYRLFLEMPENSEITLQVSVKGTIQIALPGAPTEQYAYPFPQSVQMQAATNRITFDITLPDDGQASFSPHLPVKNIAFVKIDQFLGAAEPYIRKISTVLSGILYLAERNDLEYKLRTREGLQFEESEGILRLFTLRNDQLSLQFHGNVRGMTTGWDENRKDLMPNYLERLSAQHSLALLWSTTIYLFLLFLSVWKWWGKVG